MMINSPFGNTGNSYGQGFPSPTNVSPIRSAVWPVALLVLMAVISVLLFEGLLAFPGLFLWFIGGDLTQLWFLVLVVLGLLYRGAIARRWKRAVQMRYAQDFPPEYPTGAWSGPAQRRSSSKLTQGLLHVPLALLAVFLVYYFFFVGYTFHVGPQFTVTGDCNDGTITVQGETGSDSVSLKAGLLTIQGFGNYDSANHVLNITSNVCDFTLEVPATTNLHLSGNDATISVSGVTGKIELDNNAGDITVDGSSLLAGSVISNNAGSITITHSCLVPGVQVESNGSPITKQQVKPCN
jgi:hypothetical protein